MNYYVYLLTNKNNTTLYAGVTRDLVRRVYEHKEGLGGGFSQRYGLKKLVYYEVFESPEAAIAREKQIKSWNRKRKEKLIEGMNPGWMDLWGRIAGEEE